MRLGLLAGAAAVGWFLALAIAAAPSRLLVFPTVSSEVNDWGSLACEHTKDQLKVKVTTTIPIVQRMLNVDAMRFNSMLLPCSLHVGTDVRCL